MTNSTYKIEGSTIKTNSASLASNEQDELDIVRASLTDIQTGTDNNKVITSSVVKSALDTKQDTLTSGSGINLSGSTISVDTSVVATKESVDTLATEVSSKETKLTSVNAGNGISITRDSITDVVTISSTQTSAEWGNITGTLSAQTDLQTALNAKQDTLTFDSTPTTDSTNPVTSSGIKSYVDSKVSSVYKYKGSVQTYEDLPSSDLEVGDVYNVVRRHTTDPKFQAGSNLAWTGTEWDVIGGTVDLTPYSTTEEMNQAISTAVGSETTRATNAEGVLTTNLQAEVDRATLAETTLTTNLSNEVTRASGVEETLTNSIATKELKLTSANAGTGISITRNTETDVVTISNTNVDTEWGSITGDINSQADLKASLDTKASVVDVSAEEARATAAENAIDAKVETNITNIGILRHEKEDVLTAYNAGTGISITRDPETNEVLISSTQTSAEWGNITGTLSNQTDLQTALNTKQNNLTAGTNINISENIISATDTTYTNGSGLSLTGNEFSVDTSVIATKESVDVLTTNLSNEIERALTAESGLNTRVTTTESSITTLQTGKADKATTLAGYSINDAYTKTEIDSKIAGVYHVKPSVATVDDLPLTDNTQGDCRNVLADGNNYVWTSTSSTGTISDWDRLSGVVDLSVYALKTEVSAEESRATLAETNLENTKQDNLSSSDTVELASDNSLNAIGLVNKNPNATDPIYDWEGTIEEYIEQQIASLHPEWTCFITNDETPTNINTVSHNVGDIFFTMRNDTLLNGAVGADGTEYDTRDYVGADSIGACLSNGKLPYVSYAEYASEISAHGVCGKFAWDGGNKFKVPTINAIYIEANSSNVGEFSAESLPNINGEVGIAVRNLSPNGCFQTSSIGSVASFGAYGVGVNFNASRSSSTYQNGAKVKTDRIKYRAMVQLVTEISDEAIVDTVALRNEIDDKAGFYTGILDAFGYTIGGSKPRFLQYNSARTLKILAHTSIKLGTYGWWRTNEDLVVNCETILGSTLASATQYYLYLCHNGTSFLFQLSTNSSNPSGFDNTNSIKIGWFHTQGVAIPSLTYVWVGQTLTHPYSNMQAGDIDFNSVWCPTFRPASDLAFMNYIEPLNIAVGCFLQSGTGLNTKCSPNQTITDTRIYALHQEDALSVKCRFPYQREFALFADGSNQLTSIAGSADPVTTGYHKDTAGRYMISRFGLWDCCGALWQFINSDIANGGAGWNAQEGSKGNIYGSAPVLLAGGLWAYSSNCGSFTLACHAGRLTAADGISARLVSEIESKQAI